MLIPVFINGLVNDLKRQVSSNFDGTGQPIYVVFGKPLELSEFFERRRSPRVYREISERCLEAITELGKVEKHLRQEAGE